MLLASSMAPLFSLDHDNQNEAQHDIFGHMMPLAPVSCDAGGIINGTIAFLRSRLLKLGATWPFWSMMPLAQVLASCNVYGIMNAPLHSLGQDTQNEVQLEFVVLWCHCHWLWGHMMPMAPSHSSGDGNQIEMELDIFVKWCLWHQHYKMSMESSVALLHSWDQDDQNEVQCTSYELTSVNIVTTNTGIHTIQIIGICLWTYMPATWHMYVPLH